ncbi:MAG: triose-phosphate isomerase [Pseudomonadota bacterium]
MTKIRTLIAGNWKMNGLKADLDEIKQLEAATAHADYDVLICPPFTILPMCIWQFSKTTIAFGGQDCHTQKSGAFTGDISAAMLKDIGATYVIVGHSERRQYHRETSAVVKAKAEAALAAGLTPIICVGETKEQREAGKQYDVVKEQIAASLPDVANADFVIAYEPVWAIGTGLVASIDDIATMHNTIRDFIEVKTTRLLYGGSVKGTNAKDILSLENVNGALVGGASLKAKDFAEIINAARS